MENTVELANRLRTADRPREACENKFSQHLDIAAACEMLRHFYNDREIAGGIVEKHLVMRASANWRGQRHELALKGLRISGDRADVRIDTMKWRIGTAADRPEESEEQIRFSVHDSRVG
jgi:hypothetical protein